MESPEKGGSVNAIAMDFPAYDDGNTVCSPPMIPPRIRRRLSENKSYSPASVEEIEAKLRHADLRRQVYFSFISISYVCMCVCVFYFFLVILIYFIIKSLFFLVLVNFNSLG